MAEDPEKLVRAVGQWVREQETREGAAGVLEDSRPVAPELQALLCPLGDHVKRAVQARAESELKKATQRRHLIRFGVIGLAAALAFFMLTPLRAPLPQYAIEVHGGIRDLRGAQNALDVVRLSKDSLIDLTLTPARSISENARVAAEAFLIDAQAHTAALSLPFVTSSEGAMRVSGASSHLFGERTGAWTLLVIVGRAGELPPADAANANGAQTFRVALQLQ